MSKMHIVVNEKMKEYYSEKYKETKCSVISNGFDNEEIIEDIEIKGLPEGFNVIYTGGLSSSREIYSMPIICTIIEQNKDVNFVFVGEYLKSEKQALSLYSNVYLIDKVEREKVLLIQRKAKLLLLISGENTSGTSTKLYEYLFSNIPILNIGGKNIATKIIEETKTGKTFLPTELEQIKIYINQVKNGEYFITPQNLKKYTRREQCRQLAKYLDDLSKESDR